VDHDFFNFITCTYCIDYFQTFHDFAKTRMVSIQVGGIGSAVTNEKLRTPGIPSRMGHGKHATVMVLISSV
jgi:hypothetical protein